jgi:hypothetical protein
MENEIVKVDFDGIRDGRVHVPDTFEEPLTRVSPVNDTVYLAGKPDSLSPGILVSWIAIAA